jgi:hypothetical protein
MIAPGAVSERVQARCRWWRRYVRCLCFGVMWLEVVAGGMAETLEGM